LRTAGLLDKCLQPAVPEAFEQSLQRIHDADYIRHIAAQCETGGLFSEDPDTAGGPATYRAALKAAGAAQRAVDAVMSGEAVNAFCAVRPPGHHAERSHAMGFCFFNNVAVAARHAQDKHGVKRVAIVDWDVHHGNGTQHAFYDDPSVFYFSVHQYPHYPGSGRSGETGAGKGKGYTLNAPLAAGSTDTDFLKAFTDQLRPAIDAFHPELILVSAGFDAHEDDPLSSTTVTTAGFAALTREVADMARRHCARKLVSVLEGGYTLDALASSAAAHVGVLLEEAAASK
jgi:acetoin utilization deacetylase AcuC-like enzyme